MTTIICRGTPHLIYLGPIYIHVSHATSRYVDLFFLAFCFLAFGFFWKKQHLIKVVASEVALDYSVMLTFTYTMGATLLLISGNKGFQVRQTCTIDWFKPK